MRDPCYAAASILLATVCMLAGCTKKTDAKSELDKAAAALGAAEPAPASAPTAPEPVAPASAEPTPAIPAAALPTGTPAQQMQQAIASYKSGQLEDAVTRLQKLRATPALTPQQRMALQDSVAAVMTEIYGMAAKGDPRAIDAVRQYEEMQTSRH